MRRIYFIQAGNDGPIKIGSAQDVRYRMAALQAANAIELKLLGSFDEAVTKEKYVHKKFEHLRIRGEWFEPRVELLSYIKKTITEDKCESGGDFASVKLRRAFLAWLKQEAARRGVPMYDLVEDIIARGGHRAWAANSIATK